MQFVHLNGAGKGWKASAAHSAVGPFAPLLSTMTRLIFMIEHLTVSMRVCPPPRVELCKNCSLYIPRNAEDDACHIFALVDGTHG